MKRRGCWDVVDHGEVPRLAWVRLEGDHSDMEVHRRLIILEFHGTRPAIPIERYGQMLVKEEGPGILNWLIEGYRKAKRKLDMTAAQTARVASVIMQSASLPDFVDRFIQADPEDNITVAEIIEAYAKHCAAMGWTPVPASVAEKQLPDMLLQRFGITKAHDLKRNGGKAVRGWRGVRLCFSACVRTTGIDPSAPSENGETSEIGISRTDRTGSGNSITHTQEKKRRRLQYHCALRIRRAMGGNDMTPVAIIAACRAGGCTMTPEGDRLKLAGTKPPPDLLAAIRANKAALLTLLASPPQRRRMYRLRPSRSRTAPRPLLVRQGRHLGPSARVSARPSRRSAPTVCC